MVDIINIYYKDVENITKIYYNSKKDLLNNFGYEYEDLLQEVLLYIFKKQKYYDKSRASLNTFITKLVKSKIYDIIDFNMKNKRLANLKDYTEINENESYKDDKLEYLELKETITKELTEKEKNILLLLLNGYTLEDIGNIYNITRQGVYCYKNKIKNKLSMYV